MEPRKPKPPKRITPSYLRNVGAWYVERYGGASSQVRRALMKRVEKSVAFHGLDRAECVAMVQPAIDHLAQSGLVDDDRYAEGVVRSRRERGWSARKIRSWLRAKGLSSEQIDAAFEASVALDGDDVDPERLAAIRYGRRRRLGPWLLEEDRQERLQRDLGSMARAGFSYGLARQILLAESAEALEDEMYKHGSW